MEYIYSALILHEIGKEVNEENVKNILTSAGAEPDEARIKALIASLENVDIKEAIDKAATAPAAAAAPVAAADAAADDKKEEEKDEEEDEEDEVSEEEAVSGGLGALFG